MKHFILGIILSLLLVSTASAMHLTADPQSAVDVTKYRVKINGTIFPSGIESAGDGLVRINYNIDHLSFGDYNAVAAAGNDDGQWSVWSTPVLNFTLPHSEDIVFNSGFELGKDGWNFFTSGDGDFSVTSPASEGLFSARIIINTCGDNMQLNQTVSSLYPNTAYSLTFMAKSNTGHNFRVSLFQNIAPYEDYGILPTIINVTTSWNTHTIEFITPESVTDARLMFWFVNDAVDGDEYWLDDVVIKTAATPPDAPINITIKD